MKTIIITLAALLSVSVLSAQEYTVFRPMEPDSTFKSITIPSNPLHGVGIYSDSLTRAAAWDNAYRAAIATRNAAEKERSLLLLPENQPSRIVVLDNNVLRVSQRFSISNGQAWNWSPYPDAFLDARTLSFPMPR